MEQITISYNAAQLRILVKTNLQYILDNETYPKDLIRRAKIKMDKEIDSLTIANYKIHTDALNLLWKKVREPQYANYSKNLNIQFTLAVGIPFIDGIEIEKALDESAICSISINSQAANIKSVKRQPFCALIKQLIEESGHKDIPSNSELMALYHKAVTLEKIEDLDLYSLPSLLYRRNVDNLDYICLPTKEDQELRLIIFRVDKLFDPKEQEKLLEYIHKIAEETNSNFKVYEELILAEVENALYGPQRFGLNLPLSIYAASVRDLLNDKNIKEGSKESSKESLKLSDNNLSQINVDLTLEDYPGKNLLNLSISDDVCSAKINEFRTDYYIQFQNQLDGAWFLREINRLGLIAPSEYFFKRISDNLKRERDITGLVVCEGKLPINPEHPQIRRIVQKNNIDTVDIRNNQGSKFVKEHELVAKIFYKTPGKKGTDVYGKSIHPEQPKELDIVLGPGVEKKDNLNFYATYDGMIEITEKTIEIHKTYFHKGDVNLATGNISFDGPIFIDGSIDTGARVFSQGDLHVTGNIRSGFVICKGNLTVDGGIITSNIGYIRCDGNMSCDFIENSIVFCGQNLEVKKALLLSKIYVAKGIKLDEEKGTIAGGIIYFWDEIITGKLGFKNGAQTKVYMGTDWRPERMKDTFKNRLTKLLKSFELNKIEFSALLRKKKEELSDKLIERKEILKLRNSRLKSIMERIENKIMKISENQSYNPKCNIQVHSILSNTNIFVKGKEIEVHDNLENVVVFPEKIRKSHLANLEDYLESERNKKLPKDKTITLDYSKD